MGRPKLLIGGVVVFIIIVFVIVLAISTGSSHTAELAPSNRAAASPSATSLATNQANSSVIADTVAPVTSGSSGSTTPAPAPSMSASSSEPAAPHTNSNNVPESANNSGSTAASPVTTTTIPVGATAQCKDGSYSFSLSLLTACLDHGGIAVSLAL